MHARYLEIRFRHSAGLGMTTCSPRQNTLYFVVCVAQNSTESAQAWLWVPLSAENEFLDDGTGYNSTHGMYAANKTDRIEFGCVFQELRPGKEHPPRHRIQYYFSGTLKLRKHSTESEPTCAVGCDSWDIRANWVYPVVFSAYDPCHGFLACPCAGIEIMTMFPAGEGCLGIQYYLLLTTLLEIWRESGNREEPVYVTACHSWDTRRNCAGPVLFDAYVSILEPTACPLPGNPFLPLDEGDVVAKAEFVIFRGLCYPK